MPIFTLTGQTDEPADLDGHGPIPAAMARKLVADGATSLYRVLVDPRDGAPLEIGRTSYRLPEAMKRWIRMRDGHCTFPGCSNPSTDNDTDHLTAWQHDGTTGVSNLAQLCPRHHRLKHNSGWTPTPATPTGPPGWTSPTGRHYPAQQPGWQPPHWPPGLNRRGLDSPRQQGLPQGTAMKPGSATIKWGPESRDSLEEQILAGLPVCPVYVLADPPDDYEPPIDEPVAESYPDDPVWRDFYATALTPPKTP